MRNLIARSELISDHSNSGEDSKFGERIYRLSSRMARSPQRMLVSEDANDCPLERDTRSSLLRHRIWLWIDSIQSHRGAPASDAALMSLMSPPVRAVPIVVRPAPWPNQAQLGPRPRARAAGGCRCRLTAYGQPPHPALRFRNHVASARLGRTNIRDKVPRTIRASRRVRAQRSHYSRQRAQAPLC